MLGNPLRVQRHQEDSLHQEFVPITIFKPIEGEDWKHIDGTGGAYSITTHGRVVSWVDDHGRDRSLPHELRITRAMDGTHRACGMSIPGRLSIAVEDLVYAAFVGQLQPGMKVITKPNETCNEYPMLYTNLELKHIPKMHFTCEHCGSTEVFGKPICVKCLKVGTCSDCGDMATLSRGTCGECCRKRSIERKRNYMKEYAKTNEVFYANLKAKRPAKYSVKRKKRHAKNKQFERTCVID